MMIINTKYLTEDTQITNDRQHASQHQVTIRHNRLVHSLTDFVPKI